MGGFEVRRDSSSNNVPVVGYQDTADAQDVVLWAAVSVTESGNTDANGVFTATHLPIIDTTHDWVTDAGGVNRERLIDGKDITAQDSGANPLYAGTADGKAGTIPLYTDQALTTSAVNLAGVQVTYTTLAPVSVGPDGKLQVTVAAGTASIGTVGLDAGTNIVGKVIIHNTADNGGEDNSIRIRDSLGGNELAAMGYNSDGKALPNFPLAVSDLPWLYNGDGTLTRVRNSKIFKDATATAAGDTTVWTPAAGSVAIRGFLLVGGDVDTTVQFKTGATNHGPVFFLKSGQTISVDYPNIWIPGAAGEALSVTLGTAQNTAGVAVQVWGTEE